MPDASEGRADKRASSYWTPSVPQRWRTRILPRTYSAVRCSRITLSIPGLVQQLSEQQAGRARSDDGYLCAPCGSWECAPSRAGLRG